MKEKIGASEMLVGAKAKRRIVCKSFFDIKKSENLIQSSYPR